MLTIMDGFSDNVLAVKASGQITRHDYDEVLIPAAEEKLTRHEKLRLYYELGAAFSGIDAAAMWEDCKLGFEHWSRWEKAAVVTDVEWIRLSMRAFGFLFPIRAYPLSERQAAIAWITG